MDFMEILSIPIVEFYNSCLKGAKERSYKWAISLVDRKEDAEDLYINLAKAWKSIDSIADYQFLFIFAGKIANTMEAQNRSTILDHVAK